MPSWALFGSVLLFFAVSATGELVNGVGGYSTFYDDGYYYILAARNFVDTGRFTVDGLHLTNGFHPLWMILLVGVFKLIGTAAPLATQIFSVKLLEKLCLLGVVLVALYAYQRLYKEGRSVSAGFLAIILFCLAPFYQVFECGMECALSALAYTLLLYCLLRQNALGVGLSLAALLLARLDTLVFVVGPVWIYCLLNRNARLARIWPIYMLPLGVFLIYGAINFTVFGHLTPISGVLKSSFPIPVAKLSFFTEPIIIGYRYGWQYFYGSLNVPLVSGVLALAATLMLGGSRLEAREDRRLILLVLLVGILLVGNLLLFQKWNKELPPTYFVLPMVTALFALFAAGARKLENFYLAAFPLILFIGLSSWFAVEYLRAYPSTAIKSYQEGPLYEITEFVKSHSDPNAIFAATDSGALAFWSQRRFVNLDGLVNDFDYQKQIRSGRLREYLRQNNVDYLFVVLFAQDQWAPLGREAERMYVHGINAAATYGKAYPYLDFYVYSYEYDVFSDRVRLYPSQEWYRLFIGKNGGSDCSTVFYKLRGH